MKQQGNIPVAFARCVVMFAVVFIFPTCKKEAMFPTAAELKPDEGPVAGFAPGFPILCGYLYCNTGIRPLPDSTDWQWRITGVATFREPAGDMGSQLDPDRKIEYVYVTGNTNMGDVSMNEFPLGWNPFFYKGSPRPRMSPDTSVTWRIQGNEDAPLFTDRFAAPFPKPNPSKSMYPALSKANGYKLEVTDYFSNYDSIWMNVPSLGSAMMKPGTNYLQFDAKRVKYYYPYGYDSVRVHLKASKYYYAKHAGRYYQYLFVTDLPMPVLFTSY